VIPEYLPPFVKFDKDQRAFIIKPTNPMLHLGNSQVRCSLSDSKLSNPFTFSITVTNKAPFFTGGQTLKDVVLDLRSTVEIDLPAVEDLEKLPINIKATMINGSPLPGFIKLKN
jgi:hypothetical protein